MLNVLLKSILLSIDKPEFAQFSFCDTAWNETTRGTIGRPSHDLRNDKLKVSMWMSLLLRSFLSFLTLSSPYSCFPVFFSFIRSVFPSFSLSFNCSCLSLLSVLHHDVACHRLLYVPRLVFMMWEDKYLMLCVCSTINSRFYHEDFIWLLTSLLKFHRQSGICVCIYFLQRRSWSPSGPSYGFSK